MKVVQHQTISVDLPARFGARFAQCLQKTLAILIVLEDWFSPISPVHDVINRPWILHSQLARHAANPLIQHRRVKPYSTLAGTDPLDILRIESEQPSG
jgi:hypothetical protein